MLLSASRGKEAAGLAVLSSDSIHVCRLPLPPRKFSRSKEFGKTFKQALCRNGSTTLDSPIEATVAVIGHSRLVTTGTQNNAANNQPVVTAKMVGIHNGIIVNDDKLWQDIPGLQRVGEVDSEVILALIRKSLEAGKTLAESVRTCFSLIEGAASVALLFEDLNCMVLATNTGSLYLHNDPQAHSIAFASEENILKEFVEQRNLRSLFGDADVTHIRPFQA